MTATAAVIAGARFDTGDRFVNYITGIAMGNACFLAVILLLLSDPMKECRHESQKPGEDIINMPYWKGLYNAICLTYSDRGLGWNDQAPSIPPLPRHSRFDFVLSKTLRIAWYTLLMDICYTYMDLDASLAIAGDAVLSLQSRRPWLFMFDCFVYVTTCYIRLNLAYDAFAAVVVALRLSEPRQWPVTFGRWRDAYTVRRFWERVWHQHRRRFASGIGKYAARTLGCQPGSWLSSHVQLFVGFACTGLSHVIGDYMIDPAFGWASPPFFIYQAAAIILEDAVISFGTSLGIVDALPARLVGYVWTFAWLIYSNNWLAGWQLIAGLGKHRMFPLSVVRPALEYVAATTGLDVLEIARHFVTKV